MAKKINDSLTELVGNTPLVRLHGYEKNLGSRHAYLQRLNTSTRLEASRTGLFSA